MKKTILVSILTVLTIFNFSFAKGKSCKDLASCVTQVSKLTGKKYFYAKKLKGPVEITSNFIINKKNADDFISMVLNENGYTRIPLKEKNAYRIIHARDVRYNPVSIYLSETDKNKLPDNDDYIMLSIGLKIINSTEVTRSFRPFMSRYGRIIDIKQKNRIILQDTAKNVRRLLHLVESIDVPLTSSEKNKQEERLKHKKEIEKLNAKNCSNAHKGIRDLISQVKALVANKK